MYCQRSISSDAKVILILYEKLALEGEETGGGFISGPIALLNLESTLLIFHSTLVATRSQFLGNFIMKQPSDFHILLVLVITFLCATNAATTPRTYHFSVTRQNQIDASIPKMTRGASRSLLSRSATPVSAYRESTNQIPNVWYGIGSKSIVAQEKSASVFPRVDFLNNFQTYKGGFNVTDDRYWAVSTPYNRPRCSWWYWIGNRTPGSDIIMYAHIQFHPSQ